MPVEPAGSGLEGLVRVEDRQTDVAGDQSGDDGVLLLGEGADGAEQQTTLHRGVGGAVVGEVTPREHRVPLVALDDVEEPFVRSELVGLESKGLGVLALAGGGTDLATGVGDVPVALGAPADDQTDELCRIVPDLREVDVGVGHGEAEAHPGGR